MIKKTVFFILFLPCVVFADSIRVFTDERHPISDPDHKASVCMIVDTAALQKKINADIRANNIIDEAVIRDRYGEDFKRIGQSYQCLNQARQLGITQLPTMIIGDQAIVGLSDVPQALARYGDNPNA